jgi:hypothetical protein
VKKFTLNLAMLTLLWSAWNSWSAAPANDRFSNRIILTGTNLSVSGNNTQANKEGGEPLHAGNPGGSSIWWSWTAPTNGEVILNTDGSTNSDGGLLDTLLGVYTGTTVSTLSLVASNDDHGDGLFVTSRVRFAATRAVQYQIAVDGYNDGASVATGAVSLNLVFVSEPIPRPRNDNFTNAFVLTGAALRTNGSNLYGTREPGEPVHAGKSGETSVWWRWTAPASGAYAISTAGSSFDTVLAVYRGSNVSNLIEVASNDDLDPFNAMLTSSVTFDATNGQLFWIAVDGFDGAAGSIALQITTPRPSLRSPTRLAGGALKFLVEGIAGRTYQIDAFSNGPAWFPVGTLLNTNGLSSFTDLDAPSLGGRFYRAQLVPQ